MNKRNTRPLLIGSLIFLTLFLIPLCNPKPVSAVSNSPVNSITDEFQLSGIDMEILQQAKVWASAVTQALEELIDSNRLSIDQLFDTFYIPIPNTSPQKFNTQYDSYTDKVLPPILDSCLEYNPKVLYVVAVDLNGYVPAHNSRYSKPLTQNTEYDTKNNRTKRMFNDRTGIGAARNTEPFLLQPYSRDTGQILYDLSIPLVINKRHWGAIRVGYRH